MRKEFLLVIIVFILGIFVLLKIMTPFPDSGITNDNQVVCQKCHADFVTEFHNCNTNNEEDCKYCHLVMNLTEESHVTVTLCCYDCHPNYHEEIPVRPGRKGLLGYEGKNITFRGYLSLNDFVYNDILFITSNSGNFGLTYFALMGISNTGILGCECLGCHTHDVYQSYEKFLKIYNGKLIEVTGVIEYIGCRECDPSCWPAIDAETIRVIDEAEIVRIEELDFSEVEFRNDIKSSIIEPNKIFKANIEGLEEPEIYLLYYNNSMLANNSLKSFRTYMDYKIECEDIYKSCYVINCEDINRYGINDSSFNDVDYNCSSTENSEAWDYHYRFWIEDNIFVIVEYRFFSYDLFLDNYKGQIEELFKNSERLN